MEPIVQMLALAGVFLLMFIATGLRPKQPSHSMGPRPSSRRSRSALREDLR